MAQWLTNPTRNHEVAGSIPGLVSGLRIWCCHELWCRSATVAPIHSLAQERPCAVCVDLKSKKRKKERKEKKLLMKYVLIITIFGLLVMDEVQLYQLRNINKTMVREVCFTYKWLVE